MNQSSDSLSLTPDTDWQVLGELELPLNFDPSPAIETWITDTLNPLGLNEELVHKVLRSAQDAATHARQAEISTLEFGHIHLVALASKHHSSNSATWGFFRIEKMESSPGRQPLKGHSMEFYFYREE